MTLSRCGRIFLVLMISLFAVNAEAHFSEFEIETFENEPEQVRPLLEQATLLSRQADNADNLWRAGVAYCRASQFGSAEAMYRLGMLYAFGKGVEERGDYANALFSAAAMQGHLQAQNMLETMQEATLNKANPDTLDLPACLRGEEMPKRAPVKESVTEKPAKIDLEIQALPKKQRWLLGLVEKLSKWYKIDPKLALSIIMVESNFEQSAMSPKSAMGLMQLIPETAERFNVKNAYNASQNIKGGLSYLRWLMAYFKGDVKLVVAAYNAGEGAVNKHRGVPPYEETKQYVKRVMDLYERTQHPFDARITEPSPVINKMRKTRS